MTNLAPFSIFPYDIIQFIKTFPTTNKKRSKPEFASSESGDGEIRTLVQTWNQYAFYMLSLDLIVGNRQDRDHQPESYLLKSRNATGEQAFPAPNLLAPPYRNVSKQGNRVMSRFCHCGRNKANLLYFG